MGNQPTENNPAWVEATISISALRHNLQRARRAAPNSQVLAIIKANGYGHGLCQVAQALGSADAFGVGRLEEALALRSAGFIQPIVLLGGFLAATELSEICQHNLQIVLHTKEQLHLLTAAKLPIPLALWLKIDTGMHRLGIPWSQAKSYYERLQSCQAVADIRLMSHLANSDQPKHPGNFQQIACFQKVTTGLRGDRSLANSGGVLALPQSHYHWIRPGILLYGVSPLQGRTGQQEALRPVMHFSARLLAVQSLQKGDAIGYGSTWTCPEDMRLGIVSAGYGDGYPRHAPSGTPVVIRKQRVPIVGRVSMDFLCVDLRTVTKAQVGDRVTLWGNGLPVEEIASQASTIAYQLLCGVAPRVVRRYVS